MLSKLFLQETDLFSDNIKHVFIYREKEYKSKNTINDLL